MLLLQLPKLLIVTMATIDITKERELVEAGRGWLTQPSFISYSTNVAFSNPAYWANAVLREISSYTFVLSCLPDTYFFENMMASKSLPGLCKAITSISYPNFHRFSGIRHNRTTNPYLDNVKKLTNLNTLSLGFHTADFTTSAWQERERIALELRGKVELSKKLRLKSEGEVIAFYKLDDIFQLRSLEVIDLECFDSELIAHFTTGGHPTDPLFQIQSYLVSGFAAQGRKVKVNVSTTSVPYT